MTKLSSPSSIALWSIAIAIAVLGLKSLAAWWSGSVALLSDAVESIVNVATATAALVAVIYAARPPDKSHPFGHEKAEYFVALFEALLIGAAGWSILSEAWNAFSEARQLDVPPKAYAANIAAGMINGLWCYVLIRRGREMASAALVADGWHLFSDVLSSAGVLAGILLAQMTGLSWLDPLLAMFVAVNIFWSGFNLLKLSFGGLMDGAPDPATLTLIEAAIADAGAGALQAHDLRSRVSGPKTFIEFHLVAPGRTTVKEAHAICDRIEAQIRAGIPSAKIIIHVEPEEKAQVDGVIRI